MEIKISEIKREGGYTLSEVEIVNLLKDSSKYKNRIKTSFRGTVVEGNLLEIIGEIDKLRKGNNSDLKNKQVQLNAEKERQKQLIDELKKENAEKDRLDQLNLYKQGQTPKDEIAILRSEIETLKSNISLGSQYYEYKTIVIKDSEYLGTVNAEKIELTLCKLALEGWRLKAAITNEAGHNKAVVVNATINNTILILERLVTKE